MYTTALTIHYEFYPAFATSEDARRYLLDTYSAGAGRVIIRKNETPTLANSLRIYLGAGTLVSTIAEATYSPYWVVNGRNLLSISGVSGATTIWLNGVQIATSATAWTATPGITTMYLGSNNATTERFYGRVGRLYIGHHTSTLAEHTAYWNNSMFSWRNRATVDLQFRTADYDIGNVRTLDSSGHGNHFTLGDGSTPTTYPTQGAGRMTFDGSDSLRRAAVAQPTGAFTVASVYQLVNPVTVDLSDHLAVGANPTSHILLYVGGAWRFYVGGTGTGYVATSASAENRIRSIVATWDGTTARVYQDGVYTVSATVGVPSQPAGAAQYFYIGQRRAASNYMTGTMYDFKYFDGIALNQVQALDYHQQIMRRIGSEV